MSRRWSTAGNPLAVIALCALQLSVVTAFAEDAVQSTTEVSHRKVPAPFFARTMRLFAIADSRIAFIRESGSTREHRVSTASVLVTDGARVETLMEIPGSFTQGRRLGESIAFSVFDSRSEPGTNVELFLVPLDDSKPVSVRNLPTTILWGVAGFGERIAVAGLHSIWTSESGRGWALLDSVTIESGLALPMLFDGSGRLIAITRRDDNNWLYLRTANPLKPGVAVPIPPETTDMCLISDGASCYFVSSTDEGISHAVHEIVGNTLTSCCRVDFDSYWSAIGGAAMPGAILLAFQDLDIRSRDVAVVVVNIERQSSTEVWRGPVHDPLGSWDQGSTLLVGDSRGFAHEFRMADHTSN